MTGSLLSTRCNCTIPHQAEGEDGAIEAGCGEVRMDVPLLCTAWLIMTPRLNQLLEKTVWRLGLGCSQLQYLGKTQRSEKTPWLPPLRGAE